MSGKSRSGKDGGSKGAGNRDIYHVTRRPDDKWQGKQEGGQRASVVGDTKADVQKRTIEIAKNKDLSQVKIHGADGKFQEERTYGKDPFPPKG